MEQKKIGELNGKWAILFRLHLAIATFLLPPAFLWIIWVTTEIITFTSAGPRYTADMAEVANLRLKHEILESVADNYPPKWLRDEMRSLNERMNVVQEIALHLQRESELHNSNVEKK